MKKQIEQTREFNYIAGGMTEFDLQMKLILEELKELENAHNSNNRVEVLDALADTLYVVFGMVNRFNADNVIEEAFERVHKSNMSKFCTSYEEALKTIDKYRNEGIDARMRNNGGKKVVVRDEDGKVLKSVNYKRVYLKDLSLKEKDC